MNMFKVVLIIVIIVVICSCAFSFISGWGTELAWCANKAREIGAQQWYSGMNGQCNVLGNDGNWYHPERITK